MSWKDARIGYQRDIHQSSPYILFMLINTEKIITTIYVGRPVYSQGGGIRTSRLQLLFRTLAITIVTAYMGYLTYVHGRVLVSSRKYAIQSKWSPIKYKLSCTSEHGMVYTHTHMGGSASAIRVGLKHRSLIIVRMHLLRLHFYFFN